MKFTSDIDIDVADREQALEFFKQTPASILRDGKYVKHNTGVYFTDMPADPFTGYASIDHETAEDRGYIKLDILNVGLYSQVRDEAHLDQLMAQEPNWARLYESEFCSQLIHIGNHYDTLIKMPEAVNTIEKLAMFLAVIRPAKRHLVGKPWIEVAKTVWEKPADDTYYFKKAHAISYAHLVAVNVNLISEQA
jgi:hypothetical protein